jgi:hypothetical protein
VTCLRVTLALALWTPVCFGQNAQLSGLVRDPAGLNVSGAGVNILNEQTGGRRNTRSNASGSYSLPSLSPGDYRITIRATGFETMVREGIKLEVGDTARLDFDLTIGDSRTVFTVHGGPPLMNTEDASVGTVIDRDIIDQMPLNGRGIQSLIELTPGVVVTPVVDASRGQFAVNGQRTDANYFTVDGVSANFSAGDAKQTTNAPGRLSTIGQAGGGMLPANNFLGTFSNLVSPDALQEFKIQTSTFAPEYGRSPGAQIGLITRSGGNRYSGSLFEYFRNDKTDANDWFGNQLAMPKPPLRFNNFGGTLGGPVRIPHFYNGHDRTFFFLSVEDLVLTQAFPVGIPVPTVQARQTASPSFAALLNAYPLPNRSSSLYGDPAATGLSQFAGTYPIRQDQQTYGLRLDHSFTDKLMFFVRYNRAPSQSNGPADGVSNPANIQMYALGTETLTLGLTHTVTPNVVNEIRVNGSRQSAGVSATVENLLGAQSPPDSLLFPAGYSRNDSNFNFGIFNSPLPIVLVGFVERDRSRQMQVVDNLSWSKGSHQFKFGADYRWFSPVQVEPRLVSQLYFSDLSNTTFTAVLGTRGDSDVAYVSKAFSAYAQDTWRANRRLTFTYGARWEVDPAARVSAGQGAILTGLSNLNDPSTASFLPPGKAIYPTSWSNIAPRLGIAWQMFDGEAGKTVLRAGAGRFFDPAQASFEDLGSFSPAISAYVNQPFVSLPLGPSPNQSAEPRSEGSVIAAAPEYNLPFIYEWNVTIEQSIGQQTFSAGYVAALGRRLIGYATLPHPAPYPSFEVLGNDASSSYQAMQLQFNRRVSARIRLLLSYTWSHSIDNLSNDTEGIGASRSLSQYLDPDIDRGSSDFDIRHSLNGSVIAALPAPHSGIGAVLFRNWSANSIFFARSALPTDLLASNPSTPNGFYSARPNLVPGQPLYLYGPGYPGGKSYNGAAFSNPVPGAEGNLGRNVLRGFGAWQVDFALHRTFRLTERTSLQFRVEAFNLLNHPNFANPSDPADPGRLTIANTPAFGTSTETLATGLGSTNIPGQLNPLFQIGAPRSMQFAVRLSF